MFVLQLSTGSISSMGSVSSIASSLADDDDDDDNEEIFRMLEVYTNAIFVADAVSEEAPVAWFDPYV